MKPHIVQLTSRSPQSFFCSIKGKFHLKCGCWLPATALAVSLRSGLLRQSSQCVDFSFHPLLQTDVVLLPGGVCVCVWSCLVFILHLVTVPGSTLWPCRRLSLRRLGESETLTCSLQCPGSLCFRSLFFLLLAKSFHFLPCPERCHLTRSGVPEVSFSPWFSV